MKLFFMIVVVFLAGLSIFLSTQLHQANRGDINHDGKIGAQDLSILARNWTK